jgi:hypothetical protein
MSQFTYTSYTTGLKTIDEVIEAMENLENELQNTDMNNLIAFNHTYLIITKAVQQQLGKDYFHDDALMHRFDSHFAKYYFDALKKYVEGKKCAPAWKLLFDKCKENSLYQFMYMAMGVNAHVNNDLPFTIFDIIKDPEYIKDYMKVNVLIKKSIVEVVDFLDDRNPHIQFLKHTTKIFHEVVLYIIITIWRKRAWNNYVQLKVKKIEKKDIEQNAFTLAKRLTQIKTYFFYL